MNDSCVLEDGRGCVVLVLFLFFLGLEEGDVLVGGGMVLEYCDSVDCFEFVGSLRRWLRGLGVGGCNGEKVMVLSGVVWLWGSVWACVFIGLE